MVGSDLCDLPELGVAIDAEVRPMVACEEVR